MIFTTSINLNYLPKAKTLAQSIKKYYPESKFFLGLVEKTPLDISKHPEFDGVITPIDFWPQDHERILFQYEVVEACTSIKGQLMLYLISMHPNENKFVFLDPDIQVLSRMTELEAILDTNNIVLTPHLTEPENNYNAIEENEISVHKHGIFNLGFLAVRRSTEAIRMLEWWNERLKRYSVADYCRGLFTDQKWMDQAPAFFNVYILKHPGYNLAPWNIGKRPLSIANKQIHVKSNTPLRFIHFSGFDSGANIAMITKYAKSDDPIFLLRNNYITTLKENGEGLNRHKWSYEVSGPTKLIIKAKRLHQQKLFTRNPAKEIQSLRALASFLKKKLKATIRAI